MVSSNWQAKNSEELGIGNKSVNFIDCLAKFFSAEKLDVNNKIECDKCKKQNQASRIVRMKSCKQ